MSSEKKNHGKILTENTFKIAEAALNQAQKAYMEDKSPENFQALIQVQKQYDDLKTRHEKKLSQTAPSALDTLEDVVAWLKEHGRKAGLRTVKNDVKKGLLSKTENGYLLSDVERYAQTKRTIPKPADVDAAIDIRDQKEQAEVRYKVAIAQREEHKLAIQQGKYLLKTDVYLELAGRAVALWDQIKSAYEATVIDRIQMVGGNTSDVEAVIANFNEMLDGAMAEFSKPMTISIDLSSLPEEDDEDETD